MSKKLSAKFKDRYSAELALRSLRINGIAPKNVSVSSPGETTWSDVTHGGADSAWDLPFPYLGDYTNMMGYTWPSTLSMRPTGNPIPQDAAAGSMPGPDGVTLSCTVDDHLAVVASGMLKKHHALEINGPL